MPTAAPPHLPELYLADEIATGPHTFDEVGDAHIATYHEQGYLVIEAAFTPAEIDAGLRGLEAIARGSYPSFQSFDYESHARDDPGAFADRPLDAIRKVFNFEQVDPRLDAFIEHPRMLSVMQRIMDDQPMLFQSMALVKPPYGGREKPWHQDCAYFDYAPGTKVIGAWIALDEATVFNGCMHLLPGQHHDPLLHFRRRDWQLCDTESLDRGANHCVAAPLRPGGVLLFDGLLPHGTPTNHSPDRRRALQLHYAPRTADRLTRERCTELFGGEARGASC